MIPFLVWCYIVVISSVQGDIIHDLTNILNQTNADIAEVSKSNAHMLEAIDKQMMNCTTQLLLYIGFESLENTVFKQRIQKLLDLDNKLNENYQVQEQHKKNIHQLKVNIQKIELTIALMMSGEFMYGAMRMWGYSDHCFYVENATLVQEKPLVQLSSKSIEPHNDKNRLKYLLNQLQLAGNTLFEKENRAKELSMKLKSDKQYCQQRIKDLAIDIGRLDKDLDIVEKIIDTKIEKLEKEENKTKDLTKVAEKLEKIITEELKVIRKMDKDFKEEGHFEKELACYDRVESFVYNKCWKYEPEQPGQC